MITKEIIEEYKKSKNLDFQINFLINKEDKEDSDKKAKDLDITTSSLVRILIKEFLKGDL